MSNVNHNKDFLTFMFVSDLHLGHPLLNLQSIKGKEGHKGLAAHLKEIERVVNVDHTFFLGDFFQHSISLNDPQYLDIRDIFYDVTSVGKVSKTILKGTTSHDGLYQVPHMLDHCKALYKSREGNDSYNERIRYVGGISAGIYSFPCSDGSYKTRTIGFIPDDMPGTKEEIISQLKEKMKEKGLETLDYLFTHVLWDQYADPNREAPDTPIFTEDDFPFVKKRIISGHIHTHKNHGKLVICGTATKNRFEETDRKGVMLLRDYGDSTEVEFIPVDYGYDFHVFYPTKPYQGIVEEILSDENKYSKDDVLAFPYIPHNLLPKELLRAFHNVSNKVKDSSLFGYLISPLDTNLFFKPLEEKGYHVAIVPVKKHMINVNALQALDEGDIFSTEYNSHKSPEEVIDIMLNYMGYQK